MSQADSEYASAQASVASFQQQVKLQENAVALLLGENPGPIPRGKTIDQIMAPAIPAGLPSALLDRRPDIRLAEEQLHSANAQIGAARAQYFPTISLTGLVGSASDALSSLWEGPAKTWSYAGIASIPIFTAGGIAGSVKAAEARQQEALYQYQAAIQNAFADVDNSLTGAERTKEQLAATDAQVHALARYATLSARPLRGRLCQLSRGARRGAQSFQRAALAGRPAGCVSRPDHQHLQGTRLRLAARRAGGSRNDMPANREVDRVRASEAH